MDRWAGTIWFRLSKMILHKLPGRPATPELVLPSQVYAWYRLLRSVSPTSQPPANPLLGHAKPLLAGTEEPPVTDAVREVGRGAITALTFCWPPKGHKPNQATLVTLLIKFLSPWDVKKYQVFPPCNGEWNHRPKEPWNDAGARGRPPVHSEHWLGMIFHCVALPGVRIPPLPRTRESSFSSGLIHWQ